MAWPWCQSRELLARAVKSSLLLRLPEVATERLAQHPRGDGAGRGGTAPFSPQGNSSPGSHQGRASPECGKGGHL